MAPRTARPALAALALSGALLLSACGRGDPPAQSSGAPVTPVLSKKREKPVEPAVDLGFPAFATKNTTRVAGSEPVALAAAVARSVFPGLTPETKPDAVAIVDVRDWRAALAASSLMGAPVRAPLLFSDGGAELPQATKVALDALDPSGSKAAGGAEVIRVGGVPRPDGRKTTDVPGREPFALARALDAFGAAARGKTSDRVIVVSAENPEFAAPAAAYAAKSGDPILFARRNSLPAATRAAIETHQQPKIYLLGPPAVIGSKVASELGKLGSVRRISGPDPVKNAIAFASFSETDFGWGVVDPGHGLVFSRTGANPATPAAAGPLSASGSYGPLLLATNADTVDPALRRYLEAIQPGYRTDPVRGVYNHGWIIGDARAITPVLQARLDTLLEIMPEKTTLAPAAP